VRKFCEFKFLVYGKKKPKEFEEIEITDFVKSLPVDSGIPADLDYREEITKLLIEKHK
jgi:hypothetical protein